MTVSITNHIGNTSAEVIKFAPDSDIKIGKLHLELEYYQDHSSSKNYVVKVFLDSKLDFEIGDKIYLNRDNLDDNNFIVHELTKEDISNDYVTFTDSLIASATAYVIDKAGNKSDTEEIWGQAYIKEIAGVEVNSGNKFLLTKELEEQEIEILVSIEDTNINSGASIELIINNKVYTGIVSDDSSSLILNVLGSDLKTLNDISSKIEIRAEGSDGVNKIIIHNSIEYDVDTIVIVDNKSHKIHESGFDNSTYNPDGKPFRFDFVRGKLLTNNSEEEIFIDDKTQLVQHSTYGTLNIDKSNGHYEFVLNNNNSEVDSLNNNDSLIDYFKYFVKDNAGNVIEKSLKISILGNDDKTILKDDILNINEDSQMINGNLLDNDIDVDNNLEVISFTVDDMNYKAGETANYSNDKGTLIINADGSYEFKAGVNYSGSLPTVAYKTNTGIFAHLDINVEAIADKPTLNVSVSEPEVNINENIKVLDYEIDIKSKLSDIDGSENLTLVINNIPNDASLNIGMKNSDGTWSLPVNTIKNYSEKIILSVPLDNKNNFDLTITARATEKNDNLESNNFKEISQVIKIIEPTPSAEDSAIDIGIKESFASSNLIITLDISGSMIRKDVFIDGIYVKTLEKTPIEYAKDAVKELINAYSSQGELNVKFIEFENTAKSSTWLKGDEIMHYLTNISATNAGGTSYESALEELLKIDDIPEADKNIYYMLSDGESGSIRDQIINDWQFYANQNLDEVYSVGMGASINEDYLKVISYKGNGINNGVNPIIEEDFEKLTDTLLKSMGTKVELIYPDDSITGIMEFNFNFGLEGSNEKDPFKWDIENIEYVSDKNIIWSVSDENNLILVAKDSINNEILLQIVAKDINTDTPKYEIIDDGVESLISDLKLSYIIKDSDGDEANGYVNIKIASISNVSSIVTASHYADGKEAEFIINFDSITASDTRLRIEINSSDLSTASNYDYSNLEVKINGEWKSVDILNNLATVSVPKGVDSLSARLKLLINDEVREGNDSLSISAFTSYNYKDDIKTGIINIIGKENPELSINSFEDRWTEGVGVESISLNKISGFDNDVEFRFYLDGVLIRRHYQTDNDSIKLEMNLYINKDQIINVKAIYSDGTSEYLAKSILIKDKGGFEIIDTESTYNTPIILDLDNDGIETLSLETGVKFDIDSDGDVDLTGWVGPDDGLLVRDINQDGIINDASELFGDSTIKNDGSKASDGYEALKELDTNSDGVINSLDENFDELKIWKDTNSDGKTDEGELLSLEEANVSELSLQTISSNETSNGNIIGLKSTYIDNEGNEKEAADVWFETKAYDLVLEDDINLNMAKKEEVPTNTYFKSTDELDFQEILSSEEEYLIFSESSDKLILNGGEKKWTHETHEKIDNEEFEVYSNIDVNSQIKIFVESSIDVEI